MIELCYDCVQRDQDFQLFIQTTDGLPYLSMRDEVHFYDEWLECRALPYDVKKALLLAYAHKHYAI